MFVLLLALTANFLQVDCLIADTNTVKHAQELVNDYSVQPTIEKLPEPVLRWENLLLDAPLQTPVAHTGYQIVRVIPPLDDTVYRASSRSRRGPPSQFLIS